MSQRRRILRLDSGFLPVIFGRDIRHSYEVVSDGLPPDTKIVNARMSDDFRDLLILIESDEFSEVSDGERIPEITPAFGVACTFKTLLDQGSWPNAN